MNAAAYRPSARFPRVSTGLEEIAGEACAVQPDVTADELVHSLLRPDRSQDLETADRGGGSQRQFDFLGRASRREGPVVARLSYWPVAQSQCQASSLSGGSVMASLLAGAGTPVISR
ncbi:MAG: hypothetical protein MZV70_19505 [Desulfobacterales bacterium]|nr:hypothetical protein [Desulfobacterales bacterium]